MVDTRLRLDRGRVRPSVTPRGGRFQIWSPSLQVTTRGTEFRVGAADDGTSRVEVTESQVDASNAAATVLVPQGTGTLARAGGPPAAPVALLAPPDLGAARPPLRRLPVRLTIAPVAGAVGYHWELSADATFRSLVADVTSAQPTVQLPEVPDGTYTFRVRAVDGQGLEGFDGTGPLQVDARPEAPFLMTPAPAAVIRTERPSLTWTQPANAAAFRVQISESQEFDTLLVDGSAMPGRAYVPDIALAPGSFFWRVATRLVDGEEGPFGDAQAFTIRRAPERPTAEPPAVGSDSLALRWPAGSGAGVRYQAQLARDVDFAMLESEHTVNEPQLTLRRPAPGTYYLRVRTIEADGFEGAFGTTQAFAVPPPEVVPPSPRRRWWLWLVPPVAIAGVAIFLL